MEAPRLPSGFVTLRVGNRTIYHVEKLTEALRELGFLDGSARTSPVATVEGRDHHAVHDLPGTTQRVLWKKCGRGGWIEPLLRDRYLTSGRFLKELQITESARTQGISVPRIVAIADTRSKAGWHRIEVLTEMIDGARDGADLLSPEGSPATRSQVLIEAARVLRRFHGLGFLHGDLNIKNLLWRLDSSQQAKVTLIDLDPGGGSLRPESAIQNLLRLHRSYWKGVLRGAWHLHSTELYRFVFEYFRGDRASLRDFWRSARRQARLQALRRGRRLGTIEPGRLATK